MTESCSYCLSCTCRPVWTDEDIGNEIQHQIDGVSFLDIVIEMYLPDGRRLVGPSITCAHIFARFTMLPDMVELSNITRRRIEQMEGDE